MQPKVRPPSSRLCDSTARRGTALWEKLSTVPDGHDHVRDHHDRVREQQVPATGAHGQES